MDSFDLIASLGGVALGWLLYELSSRFAFNRERRCNTNRLRVDAYAQWAAGMESVVEVHPQTSQFTRNGCSSLSRAKTAGASLSLSGIPFRLPTPRNTESRRQSVTSALTLIGHRSERGWTSYSSTLASRFDSQVSRCCPTSRRTRPALRAARIERGI